MSAPSSMLKMLAAYKDMPPLTDEQLDALIKWVETGEQPSAETVSRGHLYKALLELKLKRTLTS